jgi:hypothetical protein
MNRRFISIHYHVEWDKSSSEREISHFLLICRPKDIIIWDDCRRGVVWGGTSERGGRKLGVKYIYIFHIYSSCILW